MCDCRGGTTQVGADSLLMQSMQPRGFPPTEEKLKAILLFQSNNNKISLRKRDFMQ